MNTWKVVDLSTHYIVASCRLHGTDTVCWSNFAKPPFPWPELGLAICHPIRHWTQRNQSQGDQRSCDLLLDRCFNDRMQSANAVSFVKSELSEIAGRVRTSRFWLTRILRCPANDACWTLRWT